MFLKKYYSTNFQKSKVLPAKKSPPFLRRVSREELSLHKIGGFLFMEKVYTVRIANMELSLYSSETEEYTQSIARDVDERIREIIGDNLSVSVVNAALLVAMDYCDEVNKLKEGAENMRTQLKSYMDETAKALAERDDARRLADKLKDELMDFKLGRKD